MKADQNEEGALNQARFKFALQPTQGREEFGMGKNKNAGPLLFCLTGEKEYN